MQGSRGQIVKMIDSYKQQNTSMELQLRIQEMLIDNRIS